MIIFHISLQLEMKNYCKNITKVCYFLIKTFILKRLGLTTFKIKKLSQMLRT